MSNKPNRRQFLKQTAVVGALAAYPAAVKRSARGDENPEKSRLVVIRDPEVLKDGGIDGQKLDGMIDRSVTRLTGVSDAETAWKSLFKPEDIVGIKINGLGGRGATTHPEIAHAVADKLIRAGIKPANVIIWENRRDFLLSAGFKINEDGDGVRVVPVGQNWEDEPTVSGSVNGRLAKVLTQEITALINVPFMKDHMMAGITGALKNHYGSFHNPMTCHGNHCNPYIADLNEIPAIRDKTRLIIMDALKPLADGGPGFRRNAAWDYCGLLVSRDPVAVDTMAWKIIDDRRKETGLPSVAEAGREPAYIATAASRGLGVNDFDKMEIINI